MFNYILLAGGAAILFYLAYTDYRSYLIEHTPIILLFLLGWVLRMVSTASVKEGLWGMFFGFGIGVICFLVGMGGGDAKLMAVIGVWVGWQNLLGIIIIAALAGSLWGIVRLYKAGELKNRFIKCYRGIMLRMFYHVKGAFQIEKVNHGNPIPNTAVPFGTCLALATFAFTAVKGVTLFGIS